MSKTAVKLATLAIGYGWRHSLWHRSAAANTA